MMKILLVVLGLVGMTLAQHELDPGQFEIGVDIDDPDNLDANDIAKLESSSIVREALESWSESSLRRTSLNLTGAEGIPPGLLAALGNASLSGVILDSRRSAINEEVENTETTTPTPTTTTTTTTTTSTTTSTTGGLAASNNLQSARRVSSSTLNILQKPRWWCPYSRHLLRWFPLRHCGQVTDICFIPWANFQRITYARCHTRSCLLWNQKRLGRCHPSCYSRRRFFAVCYSLQTKWWYWRWVVLNLPQNCRCSVC